jgi:indolepyruvate ferredoxin oxidoreductase
MKGLRGTSFDVFGYSAERKMERRLISDYETMIADILPNLNAKNHRFAVALASLPDDIRGYGPVKEQAIKTAAENQTNLLEQFANPKAETKSLEAAE